MKKTSLPVKLRKSLKAEALEWEEKARKETERDVRNEMKRAEFFDVPRPPRKPVSVRLDLWDISLLKRFARRQGVSYSQLVAQWLHERLEKECEAKH